LIYYLKTFQLLKVNMDNLTFSKDLHVSAMVQIGKLNTNIDLLNTANALSINKNVLFVEYGDHVSKGDNGKKPSKKDKPRKYFYNQLTIHVYNETKANNRINVKIFNNGSVQMTGINKDFQGDKTINILCDEFNRLSEKEKSFDVEEDIRFVENLETVLINSDFDMGFPIDREVLHRSIVDSGYYSSYEPCNYPGVNIKYYRNPLRENFGICDCDNPCNGKGKDSTCKRITIAAFKSGKIIITGGRNKSDISVAHKFITEFIQENKELIHLQENKGLFN